VGERIAQNVYLKKESPKMFFNRPKFSPAVEISELEQVCWNWPCIHFGQKNLAKRMLNSNLDKVICYIGTFLQGSTKPLFTTQNTYVGWRSAEKTALFFHHAPTISMILSSKLIHNFYRGNSSLKLFGYF
jgi:hypothetical protein